MSSVKIITSHATSECHVSYEINDTLKYDALYATLKSCSQNNNKLVLLPLSELSVNVCMTRSQVKSNFNLCFLVKLES